MKKIQSRYNSKLNGAITIEWLENELSSFDTKNQYIVIEGFYDMWNEEEGEHSPNLEGILNYMDSQGFAFVSMHRMGNVHCKEMVFKRK